MHSFNKQKSTNSKKQTKYDLRILRDWLKRSGGGNNFLSGVEALPWEEEHSDLVALSGRHHDKFMRWVSEKLVPCSLIEWLRRSKKPIPGHEEVGLVKWGDGQYHKASMALSVVVSSLIPCLAIITLYHIQDLIRIYAAFGFSALFSLALALLTLARPAEIFGATAAFASVQVVFIGSTGPY
ncbi:hypothetical protein MPH_11691 [Macrophomina phaseolina MS6]|uniref:DUF6594 domain-containing protein n=1 Tax=Macrophomina phaseolina (strain MS6) TaxID=1126212 RepID=K2S3B3_MACPH|nr:hypothetical protein MPH_11691 [Macrophomina phaseolina MS6]